MDRKHSGPRLGKAKSRSSVGKKKRNHPAFPDRGQNPKQTVSTTKPVNPKKRKRRVYSEKELGVPQLNGIVPAGLQELKRGKKRRKVFIEDPESMMTIMALVRAEKEGQIESQLAKARQMEEVRQAREREREAKAERKQESLEQAREEARKGHRKARQRLVSGGNSAANGVDLTETSGKKQVSFA